MVKGDKATRAGRKEPARSFFKEGLYALRGDALLKAVYKALDDTPAWLVGGVVRNFILSAPPAPDYDFVLEGDVKSAAERVANKLGGSCFLLDEETSTWRVAVKKKTGPLTFDFALVKGDILRDLSLRDFTVNAMAVGLCGLFENEASIIDPAGGLEDAEERLLRMASPDVFDNDPLRILRAFRLSLQYGLEIEKLTRAALTQKAPLLQNVSAERIRDELILIFSSRGASRTVRALYDSGVVASVLPEFKGWSDIDGYDLLEHSLKTLEEAESLVNNITDEIFPGVAKELKAHLGRKAVHIERKVVLKLGAFLHDAGKELVISREEGRLRFIGHDFEGAKAVSEALKRLKFSNRTAGTIAGLVRNHHRVFGLAQLTERTFRAKAHLFRASGNSDGIDLVCLALSDARATRGGEDAELYRIALELLEFYFRVYSKKRPKPLLNGREVMRIFKIREGPEVGAILAFINEGVEKGLVRDKREAIEYARRRLIHKSK